MGRRKKAIGETPSGTEVTEEVVDESQADETPEEVAEEPPEEPAAEVVDVSPSDPFGMAALQRALNRIK